MTDTDDYIVAKKLKEKYPVLYSLARTEDGPPISREPISWFSVECGDGWYDLLDELSAKIVAVCPEAVVAQAKSKFAGLRFYIGNCNDEARKLISEYETKSYTVCENCGKSGTPGGSRTTVLCEGCRYELNR